MSRNEKILAEFDKKFGRREGYSFEGYRDGLEQILNSSQPESEKAGKPVCPKCNFKFPWPYEKIAVLDNAQPKNEVIPGVLFSDGEFVPIEDDSIMQWIAEQLPEERK